jgi:hypothetical protein
MHLDCPQTPNWQFLFAGNDGMMTERQLDKHGIGKEKEQSDKPKRGQVDRRRNRSRRQKIHGDYVA